MRATLKIVDQSWTGWTPEQPQPTAFTTVVSVGDQLHDQIPHSDFWGIKIVVHQISDDKMVLKTWRLAIQQPGGGIDLMTDFSGLNTVFKKGTGATFCTQTMDGGKKYSIMLVDISD